MSDVKLCPNGHYYQNTEAQCPYCPKVQSNSSTIIPNSGNESGGEVKTQILGASPQQNANADTNRTQIFDASTSTDNADKTQIMNQGIGRSAQRSNNPKPSGRRIVGWLVTYDFNPLGRDYRLFEGRNTIGYSSESDIVVNYDSKVSTHHLTLLFRLGNFLFKDELSTNGTFHNGVLSDEGKLKDGDELRIGDTTLLFRAIAK